MQAESRNSGNPYIAMDFMMETFSRWAWNEFIASRSVIESTPYSNYSEEDNMSHLTRATEGIRAVFLFVGHKSPNVPQHTHCIHCGTNGSISESWIPEVQLPCHLQILLTQPSTSHRTRGRLGGATPRDSPPPISPALEKSLVFSGKTPAAVRTATFSETLPLPH
ncbi:hypothetical protein I7I51_03931 [Histoplasma capsulatum]|uniref:Uncharacterized protein n=1 Tax=Ajellomyces capsulatus TaxID=5037 RepID=A0A8A1MAW6_AJECA|nr:hypothetical protein I7I51_03931 [Histoplasma capsulatum]